MMRVQNFPSQHLQAAADAQDPFSLSGVLPYQAVQSGRRIPSRSAATLLVPGRMTRSGWPHSSPGPYLPQPHVRFRRQRGEVREVGDVRGHHDGYVQRVRVFGAFIVFKGEDCPVLFRNVDVPYHGNDSQHGFPVCSCV